MNRPEGSIAGMMGATGLAAVGLTALRNPSVAWAGFVIGVAMLVPAAGLLGRWCRGRPRHDGFWAGWALASWSYLALASTFGPRLPTTALLDALRPWTEPPLVSLVCPDDVVDLGPGVLSAPIPVNLLWRTAPSGPPAGPERFRRIGHGLIALIAGALVGLIAGRLGLRFTRIASTYPRPPVVEPGPSAISP